MTKATVNVQLIRMRYQMTKVASMTHQWTGTRPVDEPPSMVIYASHIFDVRPGLGALSVFTYVIYVTHM